MKSLGLFEFEFKLQKYYDIADINLTYIILN